MTTHQIPLLRFLIPFILGIILSIYQKWSSDFFLYIFILLVLNFGFIAYVRIQKDNYISNFYAHDILLYLCFFFGGISVVVFKTDLNYNDHFHYQNKENVIYIAELDSPIANKLRSVQCKVRINKIIHENKVAHVNGKALLYIEKSSSSLDLLPGDIIQFTTNFKKVNKPVNPGQFNYQLFLQFHQIYDQSYIKKDQWKLISRYEYSIFNFSNRARNYFLSLFKRAGIHGQELAVASALTLGYKDELNNEIKHAYSSAGAMHVLAVSGLHVGIIYLIFNSILTFIFRHRKSIIIKTLIILLIIWAYALLTGLSPSVLRATTMLSFIIIGNSSGRNANIYNTLAASAFFLLMIDPFLIMQVGFQLSYLAVVGIVFFQPRIYNKLQFKNILLDYIWAITAVSLAAQLVTFPLGLLYFHQFPSYFLISNLLVIPSAFILLIMGVLLLITSIYPPISNIIGFLMNHIVAWVNNAVMYIDQLPFSLIEGVSISIKETYIIYAAILFISIGFSLRRFRFLNYGLLFIICLFIIDLREDFNLKGKEQIVIYNVKGHVAIDLIKGKEHLFISDSEFYNDHAAMLFNVKHHWYDMDLNRSIFCDLDSSKHVSLVIQNDTIISFEESCIQFGERSYVLFRNEHINIIDENAVILLSGKYNGEYIDIIKKYKGHSFIGLSDLSYSQRSNIEYITNELNIDYYDINDQGAWVFDLPSASNS